MSSNGTTPLCAPRHTRTGPFFYWRKNKKKTRNMYIVGAVLLSLPRRENGCKPFCNAACAELGLFRISIAFPGKVRRVVSAAA